MWGSGTPRREFLHADDLANGCLFLLNLPEEHYGRFLNETEAPLVNIGTGEDVTIRELAEIVQRVTGFEGQLAFDASKPDGTPRKLMDGGRMHGLGWRHTIQLEEGVRSVYEAVKDRFVG